MRSRTNKIIVGLTVLSAVALFPLNSISKTSESAPDTVTLSSDNLIVLNKEVDGDSTSEVIMKAKELDAKLSSFKEKISGKKPLYLVLYTPGGSIQSGLEMIEALKGLGRPVNTVTIFAASMGFQIVQNLDQRLILRSGVLMSHHATGEVSGEFGGSVKSQMENRQQLWLDRIKELDEQTVKRTNGKQTYESYTKEYDHECWLTGAKAVNEGYADKIVTAKCDSSLKGVTTYHASFLGLDVAYDLDNCPLNTSPMNIRIVNADKKTEDASVIEEIKSKFIQDFETKQKQAIPMSW